MSASGSRVPAVSVLMPVYNARRYVSAAVDSVLRQTLDDLELIVIDDGSADGSTEILRGYARRDPRVVLVSRPNTGYVVALNEALGLARGEFVARMDADDLCDASRLTLQVGRLRREPGLVALGSCAVALDPDGRRLGRVPVPLTHEAIEANHLRGRTSIFHPAATMRAAALRAVGGYREDLRPVEDFDLWLRLGEVGRLANLAEPLFMWRRTVDGVVATTLHLQPPLVRRVLAEAWARRRLPGTPPAVERRLLSRGGLYRQWGWMALRDGQRSTAGRYAVKSVAAEPTCAESWKLCYCAARGR